MNLNFTFAKMKKSTDIEIKITFPINKTKFIFLQQKFIDYQ